MKKRIGLLLSTIVALNLITGCGLDLDLKSDTDENTSNLESSSEDDKASDDTSIENESANSQTDSSEENDSDNEEDSKLLEDLQTWIDDAANYVVLFDTFESADEISWENLLVEAAMRGFVGRPFEDSEDDMKEEFLELSEKEEDRAERVRVMTDEDIAEYTKEKTGTAFTLTKELAESVDDAWYYSEKFDLWYCYCSYLGSVTYEYHGIPEYEFECLDATKDGDGITLFAKSYKYTNLHEAHCVIHLQEVENGYEILSNVFDWEAGSVGAFTDSFSMFDDEVNIYVYDDYRVIDNSTDEPTGEYRFSMALVSDNEVLDWNSIDNSDHSELGDVKAIKEITVCDFDMDKVSDIIAIIECEKGSYPLLYCWDEGYSYGGYFLELASLSSYVEKELDDPTPSEIVEFLTDGCSETGFSDYVQAYKNKIRNFLGTVPADSKEDISFDLIYFNNDDVPELVIGYEGYWVSVYEYVDGFLYAIVDGWGYGAGGNSGYEYYEKAGVISNFDQDGAGAEYYSSYFALNEETHTMEEVLYYHGVNDESCGEPGYYAKVDGEWVEVTEEEYHELLDGYLQKWSGLDPEYIIGTKSYDEIMEELS